MNKKITLFVVAVLCLCATAFGYPRPPVTHHPQSMDTIHPLTIGDTVPDLRLGNRSLSDYKNQLVILDFWATWCSPCIAMLPKMDSLQRAFAGKLQVVAVTYQPDSIAAPFLERLEDQRRMPYTFEHLNGDELLRFIFPHQSLPHYVWLQVDAEGVATVQAITDFQHVHAANIQRLLAGEPLDVPLKQDERRFEYDPRLQPLFAMQGTVGDHQPLSYYTILTGYRQGLGSGLFHNVTIPGDSIPSRRITIRNQSMVQLYQTAYGQVFPIGWNRTSFKVAQLEHVLSQETGSAYDQWLRDGHGHCFEMVLPATMAPQAFQLMRSQLDAYFTAYRVVIETHPQDCLVLHRTSEQTPFAAQQQDEEPSVSFQASGCALRNRTHGLRIFANRLGTYYLQALNTPVLDETAYPGAVDLLINAPLHNVAAINRELARYDLALTVKKRPIEVMVVYDREVKL